MNSEPRTYENFPAKIVVLSTAVAVLLYGLGAYILGRLWVPLSILYLLYCLWLEVHVLKRSCVHCYYYGKVCGLGKGKLCSWLFQKGDSQHFAEREVSWREMVPDMMVLVLPLAGGIVLLIKEFTWLPVVLLVILVFLSLGGNAIVRGSFACRYCRQREIGCPAEKLFGGTKT